MTKSAIDELKASYISREQQARARHARGEKVIGYFSWNVPEELILAAGMFPVQLSGSPDETTELGDQYMEDFFDGYIRSIFNRMLTGHFNFVDLIVIPRTTESYLQLYYFLQEIERLKPEHEFPELYLFDLLQTNNWLTGRYVRGRMDDFKQKLEQVSGKLIEQAAVTNAIKTVNRNRALLSQVNAFRREIPPKLSGSDLMRVTGASTFIEKSTHSQRLENLLDHADQLKPLSGPRLMVKGSPLDNTALYELIEACGAVIVADDHAWSERVFEHQVREDFDAMEALTEHYHLHSPSPRQFPQARQDEIFMNIVEQAKVEGVIFYIEEYDDTLGWDYPGQKKMLDAKGIPSLYLKKQSYRQPDEVTQKVAVTAFISSLKQ